MARILGEKQKAITTILVGNNLVNIWASSIATAFALELYGQEGLGIATAVMTVLIIFLSEIIPKTFASNSPEHIARKTAPLLLAIGWLLTVPVAAFSALNSLFLRLLDRLTPESGHRLTEDEIRTVMELGKHDGALEEPEHILLKRAIEFNDSRIREIMTPRTAIKAISDELSIEDLRETFRNTGYSRLPVYHENLDGIQGFVHYKDLLFLSGEESEDSIASLIRPVLFVPETAQTTELLKDMDRQSRNMAIVVDEHGSTAGLVTIDDAIAAVFGGIRDEYDIGESGPEGHIQIFSSSHIRVPGNLRLSDFNALLKTDLDSDYYETIGGFLLEKAGKLPTPGERFRYQNIFFRVEDISGRRIGRVDVRLGTED